MRKWIIALSIGVILMAGQAFAFEASMSSGAISSSSQACSGRCYFSGMTATTNGTNDATITVYCGTSASGTLISKLWVPGGVYAGRMSPLQFPIACETGIYVVVSGTEAGATIEYLKK